MDGVDTLSAMLDQFAPTLEDRIDILNENWPIFYTTEVQEI